MIPDPHFCLEEHCPVHVGISGYGLSQLPVALLPVCTSAESDRARSRFTPRIGTTFPTAVVWSYRKVGENIRARQHTALRSRMKPAHFGSCCIRRAATSTPPPMHPPSISFCSGSKAERHACRESRWRAGSAALRRGHGSAERTTADLHIRDDAAPEGRMLLS